MNLEFSIIFYFVEHCKIVEFVVLLSPSFHEIPKHWCTPTKASLLNWLFKLFVNGQVFIFHVLILTLDPCDSFTTLFSAQKTSLLNLLVFVLILVCYNDILNFIHPKDIQDCHSPLNVFMQSQRNMFWGYKN